jgi:4-carboxymuconolactone decarboxylase
MSLFFNFFPPHFITFSPPPKYNKALRTVLEAAGTGMNGTVRRRRRGIVDYLPEIYQEFRQRFPEISGTYDNLAAKCHDWGPLEEKTRRLVKLGVAIGLSSEGGVRSHARRALEEGITPDEVRHAVVLALTTAGFPAMIAAMKWVDEVIEKEGK